MSYRGENLTLQLTPVQLEVLTTALENPALADLLASDEQGEKLTNSLLEMKQTTKVMSQMVNERGFGYDDNFGEVGK
tara:strand:+ start:297 stop:527 length:231 start_codon:yes stop_codon:yes gene_type:complete